MAGMARSTRMTYFRENIERMGGYLPGHQPVGDVVKLNTNENPYPCSPNVMEAIRAVTEESLRKYPKVHWDDFREVAGKVLDVSPESIVCGNGGDEILTILVRCCCDRDRPLAYPVSTYSLYPVLAQIQDCATIEIPFETEGGLPGTLFDNKAGLTILCNPNSPSTTLIPVDEVARLAESLAGVLLIDEAYVDFARWNCLELVKQLDNVAVLRSMSKGYSLAGLRFGYCVASEKIVTAMCKVKDSYNLNAITQAAAVAAISDQQHLKQNVAKVIVERDRLSQKLVKLGFKVPPSDTNFLLAEIATPSAKFIYEKLCKEKIYVRYFNQVGLDDKLRITIGASHQNIVLSEALASIV
jgi:histidinol-phosphate aminotransferase